MTKRKSSRRSGKRRESKIIVGLLIIKTRSTFTAFFFVATTDSVNFVNISVDQFAVMIF